MDIKQKKNSEKKKQKNSEQFLYVITLSKLEHYMIAMDVEVLK